MRPTVEALEAILGNALPVLDHGFIRVVDYMGDDDAIVQAARVSYGTGTKQYRANEGLIRYLMSHDHTSPFEMCELKLHIKLPIFVARQWIRHRTANVNEYSARYSVMDREFYLPEPEHLGIQSKDNKQGRLTQTIDLSQAQAILNLLRSESMRAYDTYAQLLDDPCKDAAVVSGEKTGGIAKSIARELARIGLTLNYYTQWYWKTDLHNLLHFIRLRADPHAQYEIRAYAEVLLNQVVRPWVPITTRAFEDYRLYAVRFSRPALEAVRRMLQGQAVTAEEVGMNKREWDAFLKTLS